MSALALNRALPDLPPKPMRLIDATAQRIVAEEVHGENRRYVFTKRVTGQWIQIGFPSAASWGRRLMLDVAAVGEVLALAEANVPAGVVA